MALRPSEEILVFLFWYAPVHCYKITRLTSFLFVANFGQVLSFPSLN